MSWNKALMVILFVVSTFTYAGGQTYELDPLHTSVTWQISHFDFSRPSGKWMIESGTLFLDENNLTQSKVNATIEISDIDSGITKLDQNLMSSQFLDADH
ncbi:MAG: YceI family protein, partial [Burkholderiaceae bacterium]|nr:YceI family protein [Burkholderiaceae bacterium]